MPYEFGNFPDELIDIHFPHGKLQTVSDPWFWFLKQQTPRYFQYIAPQIGGHGWQCEPFLPVIKILPIDTQPLVPTAEVGFGSIEEAVRRTNAGEPISQDAWGRFIFGPKGGGLANFFWPVIGQKKPQFTVVRGRPTQTLSSSGAPIAPAIEKAVNIWRDDWNSNAVTFNAAAQGVDGGGTYTVIGGNGAFAIPLPRPNIPLPELQQTNGQWYFGPDPPTYIFETGNALIWKQAYAFTMEIGQLDDTVWDMSVWPPQDATLPTYEKPPSAVSKNYGGYSPTFAAFPQTGPIIV